jgi:hypothetical protein
MRHPKPRTVLLVGSLMLIWHVLYFMTDGAIARF